MHDDIYPGASNTSTSKREGIQTAKTVVWYEAGDIQKYIDERMREGMVRGDTLNTYEHYLKSVEQNEIQPFRSNSTSEN